MRNWQQCVLLILIYNLLVEAGFLVESIIRIIYIKNVEKTRNDLNLRDVSACSVGREQIPFGLYEPSKAVGRSLAEYRRQDRAGRRRVGVIYVRAIFPAIFPWIYGLLILWTPGLS